MSRTRQEREASVWRWVQAAREVSQRRDQYRQELARTTKLSLEGIDLALDHALETDPSQAEVESLVAGATETSSVTVVLSSNVFTACLRAIALAKAAAETVVVKPSRREPLFVRLLAEHANDRHVTIVNELDIAQVAGEVHAYGSDLTLRAVAAQLSANTVLRGHGSGFGIATLDASAPLVACAEALSRDVVLFDQSGCLSPRIAFVVGNAACAEAFAYALHEALAAWSQRVPRGAGDDHERAELRRYLDAMHMVGGVFEARDHAVTFGGRVTGLPPAARVMHVVGVPELEAVEQTLGALGPFVTCVGCYGAPPKMRGTAGGFRMAALGMMQSPPFDGPVDPRRWPPSTAI